MRGVESQGGISQLDAPGAHRGTSGSASRWAGALLRVPSSKVVEAGPQRPSIAARFQHRAARLVAWLHAPRGSASQKPSQAAKALALLSLLVASASASAADQHYSLLLDTDNKTATGCTVTGPNGPVAGIEQVLTTVVTTTTTSATVTNVQRQVCSGGTLSAATTLTPGSWPVGPGAGVGGSAVIETLIARNLLPSSGTMRVSPVSLSAAGAQDSTAAFLVDLGGAPPPAGGAGLVPAPLGAWLPFVMAALLIASARWWRRHLQRHRALAGAMLLVVSTLLVAGTVVLDGAIADWTGIAAAVTAPADANGDANMRAVFYQSDASNLYFRIDAAVQPDVASPAVTVNAGNAQSIVLPATAALVGSASLTGTPAAPFTYQWRFASGTQAAVLFADATQAATTATFDQPGDYTLQLTATSGALSNSAQVTIHVTDSGPTLAAVPNRQLALGASLDLVLAGSSPSITETLTYALTASPQGSALDPQPKVAWTPTAAQLGPNSFTAKVTDSHGRSDAKSFTVTVVANDRAPVLDAQPDATVARGSVFTRTIHATDPDNDTLTYAVSDAPAGLAIAGSALTWDTATVTPGRYYATVQATDPGGLFDARRFAIDVTDAAAPVANDDAYQVHQGDTLSVAAAGVLANDVSPMGSALSAQKLSDPTLGVLTAFNADGSFTFVAPATTATPFAPVVKWQTGKTGWSSAMSNMVVVPVPGRTAPLVLAMVNPTINTSGVSAFDGATGTIVWTIEGYFPAPNDQCFISGGGGVSPLAAGDIDDSGTASVILPAVCNDDATFVGAATRLAAVSAATGALKWITAPLGAQQPGTTNYYDMVSHTTPVIARLTPAQTPSVLIERAQAGYLDGANTVRNCDQFQANSGLDACTGLIAVNGSDGSVRRTYIAPADGFITGTDQTNSGAAPIVADLPGSCTPCVLANGAVWDAGSGSLVSNLANINSGFASLALAKVDDGSTAILRHETGNGGYLIARRVDGTVIWKAPVGYSTFNGKISVGDLNGDGEPDVLLSVAGTLYAYDAHGNLRWQHRFVDINGNATIENYNRPAIFDLAGDGTAEVIVETQNSVVILDGKDGSTKVELAYATLFGPSDPGFHDFGAEGSPIVADIDASGHASVVFFAPCALFGGTPFVVALAAQDASWRDARPVFGEFSYHVSDINDDASIPAQQGDPFSTPRTNLFGNQAAVSDPVDPRTRTQASFDYAASAGGLVSNAAHVVIDILPPNRPPVFDSTPPTRYIPGTDLATLYHPHATDPDVGDTVTYSVALAIGNNISGCQIDASTGAFVPNTCPLFAGDENVVIAATDSQGAITYQTLAMQPSPGLAAVPDVTGDNQASANALLGSAGFVTGTIVSQYGSAAAGQVLAQAPVGGTMLAQGEAVSLTVSLGPVPVAVPFVVGELQSVANAQLATSGFTVHTTFAYSNVAPAGQVLAQTPDAGAAIQPTPANPVALTVSAGTGLKLRLSQNFVNDDQSLTATVTHVALDGTETPAPTAVLTVMPGTMPIMGSAPTVSGTTITPAANSLGGFVVVAADIASGASDSAPLGVGGASTTQPDIATYAEESQRILGVQSLLRDAQTAVNAGDMATAQAKATAAVNLWRAFDQRGLRLASPLRPPVGHTPDTQDLAAHGVTQTADDAAHLSLLEGAVAQFDQLVTVARDPNVTDTGLAAAVAPVAQTAQALAASRPTVYGIVDAHAEYTVLMSHQLPDVMDALTDELAVTLGMPAGTPHIESRGSSVRRPSTQSTFLETTLVQSIAALLATIDPAAQLLSNANAQLSSAMAVIALAGYLHTTFNTDQLPGVVAGESASFLEFFSPYSFVEVNGANGKYPVLTTTVFIGPDNLGTASSTIDLIRNIDPSNRTASYIAAINLTLNYDSSGLTQDDLIAGGVQTAQQLYHGCVFSDDSSCVQLVYLNGIDTVYANPPGSIRIPLPVIALTRNVLTDHWSMTTVLFMPCQANKVC